LPAATKTAEDLGQKNAAAFKSIKTLLRQPIVKEIVAREKDSIHEFVDIWYSEETWANLQEIKIYS
jgi:predicted transcriptional regulator